MEDIEKRKQDVVDNLKKEIDSLEREIKHAQIHNKKEDYICKLKITKNITKLVMPFLLAGTISYAGFNLIDSYDFSETEKIEEKANYDSTNIYAYCYYLFSFPLNEFIAYKYHKKRKFNITEENDKVIRSNKYIAKEKTEKILKIKKDNYDFLTK